MKKALLAEGLVLLSLVSCGGGSKSGSGGSSSIDSQFIDAPVKGLNIERTVSGNGSTGDLGKFTCVANEVVTFKLRNLTLGSAVCGAKIYLDDVASGNKRNNIAAVLQNLSTTAASGGVIDLSSVPAAQDLSAIAAVINTAVSGTLMTAVGTARSDVEAAAGVTLTPAVTHAAAIAHANSNLPAPETELASTLDGYLSANPTILATRTAGNAETCWQYYTAQLDVSKAGNGYLAAIVDDSVIGSDTTPAYSCGVSDSDCSLEGVGLEGYAKVVKDGTATFIEKEQDTFSLTTSEIDGYPAGSVKVTVLDLLGNMGDPDNTFVEYFGFKTEDETGYYSLGDIKSYFPYTDISSVTVDVTFSKDGTISGSVVDDSINMDVTDYVSPTNYTLVKSKSGCTYSISKATPPTI